MRGLSLGLGLGLGSGGSGATSWNPLTVPNCVLYLNAGQSATVSQWSDLSGNGNHFVQATTARQFALLTTGGINGGASYQANGASPQGMTCVNTMATIMGSATAGERFILAQLVADGVANASGSSWGSGDVGSFYEFSDSSVYDGFGTSVRKNGIAITAGILTSPFVQDVQSAAGAFTIVINGTTYFTTATNTFGAGSTAPTIGSATGAAGHYMIKMALAFTRTLTPTERTFIRSGMV